MDILKIRKRGRRSGGDDSTLPQPSSSSQIPMPASPPVLSSSSSQIPTSVTSAPPAPIAAAVAAAVRRTTNPAMPVVTGAAAAAPSAPAMASPVVETGPVEVPVRTVAGTASTLPQPAESLADGAAARAPARDNGDPLREFLARYDDGAEAVGEVTESLEAAGEEERRFLSFVLAGERYAASIMDIREIVKLVTMTSVPRAPRDILGVISKRGIVMPVIDLAAVLGLRTPDSRATPEQRILVVGEGERVCGLRVDDVSQVVRLSAARIEEVPPSLGQKNASALIGLGRTDAGVLILLDLVSALDVFATSIGLAPSSRPEAS